MRLIPGFKSAMSLLALLVLPLSGCHVKPRPPVYGLYQHKKLVILPFENQSREPALARAIQDQVLADIVRLNSVPVAEEGVVASYIKKQNMDAGAFAQDAEARAMLAKKMSADAILAGSVDSYTESIEESAPERIRTGSKENPVYKWGYYVTSRVNLAATGKLVDSSAGTVRWVRNVQGQGYNRQWIDLAYEGVKAEAPTEGWGRIVEKAEPKAMKLKKKKDRKGRGGHSGDDEKHGKGKGDPHKDGGAGDGKGGPTIININIQNSQQNTQTQNQQQAQQQAASASANAGVAAEPEPFLYEVDAAFAKLRQDAIRDAVYRLTDDFKARGGWTPGMPTNQ